MRIDATYRMALRLKERLDQRIETIEQAVQPIANFLFKCAAEDGGRKVRGEKYFSVHAIHDDTLILSYYLGGGEYDTFRVPARYLLDPNGFETIKREREAVVAEREADRKKKEEEEAIKREARLRETYLELKAKFEPEG